MATSFAPESMDRPAVDAVALALLVALAVTVGAYFRLESTVVAGAVVLGAGGYALFRLIYALEAIASALDDSEEAASSEATYRRSRT